MIEHRRIKLLAITLWLILFGGVLFAFNAPASAQDGGRVAIAAVDTTSFPEVKVQFTALDAGNNFVSDLSAGDVQINEGGTTLPVDQLSKLQPGVQFILAVNAGPDLGRSYGGIPRSQYIDQQLLAWTQNRPADSQDQFSVETNADLSLVRSAKPQDWAEIIGELDQVDYNNETPDLSTLTSAVDLATDSGVQNVMKSVILYVTPLFTPDNLQGISDLASRASQQNVTIDVWLVGTQVAANASPDLVSALQDLAGSTGGQTFLFSGAETLPDIDGYLKPYRYLYQASYPSKIASADANTVQVQVNSAQIQANSVPQNIQVNVLPPNPIFLAPQAQIDRTWQPDTHSKDAVLAPQSTDIHIMIEFPDGFTRPLRASKLYVDDALVAENTQEPFDTFSWDLSKITASGQHMLRTEIEDLLGLTQSSITIPIMINVEARPTHWWDTALSGDNPLALAAILVAGLAILLVLGIGGNGLRKAIQERGTKKNDPLTQTVVVRKDRSRVSAQTVPHVERPTWPRSATAGLAAAPAWLVRLPENEPGNNGNGANARSASAIPLIRREVTLGSDPKRANFSVNSTSMSGLHARIVQTPEGNFQIFDAGSVAGTWVNYAPVPATGLVLRHGDLIHLGRAAFRFELANPPEDYHSSAGSSKRQV